MTSTLSLAIILTATMKGAQAFDKAGRGIRGMGSAISSIMPMLKLFAAMAAFNFLKDSIRTAMEFEQTMAEAGSIVGKTADEMKGLGDEVRAMSQVIPKTPKDLGLAIYDIFSAGITDGADAMSALELSAKAASAGLTETATAARAGISTMNAFGMEADDLTHIFDVQFLTIRYGILRYGELADVIGQVAPSAKNAGQSMESMFAALALLTKQGLNARMAAVSLARAMDGITKPTTIRAAAELGIQIIELTDDSRRAQAEFLSQKRALDELTNSYDQTQARVKSLGEEMAKVSLDQMKNRLKISEIERNAANQNRALTESELAQIESLRDSNADLQLSYDRISVSQAEARIESTKLSNSLATQKESSEAAKNAFDEQIAATGNFRPLVNIIKEIEEKYGHLGEAARADIISQMFPEIRARRAITAIMGNTEEMIAMTDEMTNSSGAMGEAYAINTATAAAEMQLMQNSMEDMKIEMGNALIPVMQEFIPILRDDIVPIMKEDLIPLFIELTPAIKLLAEGLGWLAGIFNDYPGLLDALIAGLIAAKIATIALNLAMYANPAGIMLLAIIAVVAALIFMAMHWDEMVETFKRDGPIIDELFVDMIQDLLETTDAFDGVISKVSELVDWLMMLKDIAAEAMEPLTQGMFSTSGGKYGGASSAISSIIPFAEGGIVTSPTLGLVGERGPEMIIPLKNGAVPVDIRGGGGGGDTYEININTGVLAVQETPESIAEKFKAALMADKMRGRTGVGV